MIPADRSIQSGAIMVYSAVGWLMAIDTVDASVSDWSVAGCGVGTGSAEA